MIEKLFLAGADVFRLNFSHGSQEQKKELLDMIRQVEEKYSHPICVLGDLQGPKLRVGEFSKEFEILEKGQTFRLDMDSAKGDNTRVMLPHPEILAASEVGHALLVDDGKVKLTVIAKADDNTWLDCHVDVPGKISNRKVRGCGTTMYEYVQVFAQVCIVHGLQEYKYSSTCTWYEHATHHVPFIIQ